ncbi:deacylase [Winogradskyella sp. J14-2]|uniref:acyloxyacyl hydrolase n=1 Tax=Winogradskyella sp. J14-2 TaxID=1936080 RepID=UPI0009729BE8|nr:acyloxyacyl hydrolase [Winogradskyella sp. J14-2]APY06950.1 deacylase [Winogradskyella sp. J14-2]
MKCHYLVIIFLLNLISYAQKNEEKPFSVDLSMFYGTILEHNPDISHLITDHPTGVIISYNRKTYGFNEWERRYNYPDWGFSLSYQDMKNEFLGENIGLYGHFNFYFLKRNLVFRVGQGITYATKPYHRNNNFKNNAYGSHILSSTYLKFDYIKENLYKGLGVSAGFTVIHYSNANIKAPNNSTNTFAFSAGINYLFNRDDFPEYIPEGKRTKYSEPLKYNLVFRSGINESDINGSGQFPFYVFTGFVDKRINHKSTLLAGTELFVSFFLKEYIKHQSIAFPENGIEKDTDFKRIGVFIGHELRFNKVAFITHLGYYLYWPVEFENRVYNRLGLKRYFTESLFGVVNVHSHGAKAEAVEFGIGIRL